MSELREKVEAVYRESHSYSFDDRIDAYLALFEPYEKLVEAALIWKDDIKLMGELYEALEPFQPKRPRTATVGKDRQNLWEAVELTPEVTAALVAAGIIEEDKQ